MNRLGKYFRILSESAGLSYMSNDVNTVVTITDNASRVGFNFTSNLL